MYWIQHQARSGNWSDVMGSDELDETLLNQLAYRREMHPKDCYRLVHRTDAVLDY